MEVAIENSLRDVKKLEDQILSMLTSLKSEELLSEAPLLLIPTPLTYGTKTGEEKVEVSKKRKTKAPSVSQMKSKKVEIDSAAVPMDISLVGQEFVTSGNKFTLIESSLFLLPVMDNWVFGMTLVNSSEISQNLPQLILTIMPSKIIDTIDKPCRVFTYSVQVNSLDVKQESMDNRNVCQGIPYHDTIILPECNVKIRPGCQVLVTATFTHPLGFCSTDNQFILIASLCLDGIQLWSRTITAGANFLSITKLNEEVFKVHHLSILMALGQYKEYFKMERLLTQGDKSLHKALEKFLVPLGFDKKYNESIGFDRSMEVFSTTQTALLWGMLFKYEKCFRNVNMVRCLVSARSEQQIQIFFNIFESWIRKEGQRERNEGLKGLSMSRINSYGEDKSMINTLRKEIQTLMELIRLGNKGTLKSASSRMDHKWIKSFKNSLAETDFIFMQHFA